MYYKNKLFHWIRLFKSSECVIYMYWVDIPCYSTGQFNVQYKVLFYSKKNDGC